MPGIKGHSTAFSHVSTIAGRVLATKRLISGMFCDFERNSLPREIKPPEKLALFLDSLTCHHTNSLNYLQIIIRPGKLTLF